MDQDLILFESQNLLCIEFALKTLSEIGFSSFLYNIQVLYMNIFSAHKI